MTSWRMFILLLATCSYQIVTAHPEDLKSGNQAIGTTISCDSYCTNNSIFQAIMVNDIDQTSEILKCGADPNQIDCNGRAPLSYAIAIGNLDLVAILLEFGADINTCNSLGRSALFEAVLSGDFEMCQLLIDAGVNIDLQDNFGMSALMCAADNGYHELIRLLLANHASESLCDVKGKTALEVARLYGEPRSILLLDKTLTRSHRLKLHLFGYVGSASKKLYALIRFFDVQLSKKLAQAFSGHAI